MIHVAIVWGPPGPGRINGRFTISRGRLIKSVDYRRWCARARWAIQRDIGEGVRLVGPVHVEIAVYWPRAHRDGPAVGLAFGDVDALAKATLDSLQAAGAIEDDAQVTRCVMTKHIAENKTRARVEIRISNA